MFEMNLTYLQTNPILEGVRGNLYEINFYFSASQKGFHFSGMFFCDEESAPSVVKYTLAVRTRNRNAGIEDFLKMRGAGEYDKVKSPKESFLLSLLWFLRGFVVGTVASAPMPLGLGGLGEACYELLSATVNGSKNSWVSHMTPTLQYPITSR